MFKPLLLAALLVVSTLPAIQPAQAEGLSIDLMPGVSLRIGEQDNRGRYWDGYDWRPPQWWHAHQGRGVGERNSRGLYWDGGRWRDHEWWGRHYDWRDNHWRAHDEHRHDHHDDHDRGRGPDRDWRHH